MSTYTVSSNRRAARFSSPDCLAYVAVIVLVVLCGGVHPSSVTAQTSGTSPGAMRTYSTIIQGKPFVSARFAGRGFERAGGAGGPQKTRRHEVQCCTDEASLLDGFARFAAASLEAGSAAIVVTTSPHRPMVHQRVQAYGLDVDRAIAEGRYVWLDVADSLSAVMVDGWPDDARFWRATPTLVDAATRASTCTPARVTACGECAPSLWTDGRAAAAIRLEQLWDALARARDVHVLCGYSVNAPLHGEEQRIFERICAEHSAVRSR